MSHLLFYLAAYAAVFLVLSARWVHARACQKDAEALGKYLYDKMFYYGCHGGVFFVFSALVYVYCGLVGLLLSYILPFTLPKMVPYTFFYMMICHVVFSFFMRSFFVTFKSEHDNAWQNVLSALCAVAVCCGFMCYGLPVIPWVVTMCAQANFFLIQEILYSFLGNGTTHALSYKRIDSIMHCPMVMCLALWMQAASRLAAGQLLVMIAWDALCIAYVGEIESLCADSIHYGKALYISTFGADVAVPISCTPKL